jgi:glycosyltransferase 2 family protein
MRCNSHVVGALLGVLLTTLAVVVIAVRTDEIPHIVSLWPLLAALGTSVVTWWLQGLIYAVLARPQLKGLRLGDMFRIEMAGLFVALISPIRGAELPYKAFLMKRSGLSVPEGSNVVTTRVLLDAVVLTPAALVAVALYSPALPEVHYPRFLLAGLAAVVLAAVAFPVLRRVRGRTVKRTFHLSGAGWQAKAGAKISGSLRDMHGSFTSYWRPGYRGTLGYAIALAVVYWALRLCAGPLALMAVGWSGDWIPVVVAQLLLVSFVLPLAPTPGGSGARELGLGVLLDAHVPEGQLLSGLIVYSGLTHWLPVTVAAFFAGYELWREILRGGGQKAAGREGHAEAITQILPAASPTTAPRCHVSSRDQELNEASRAADCIPEGSRA